jgi:uncharacterized protein YjbI with pentapeptide repeats
MQMTSAEFEQALAAHAEWVASAGGQGERLWLEDADLRGADLAGRPLDEAHLAGAQLDGANLANASVAGANLASASLDSANFDQASLAKANLDFVRAVSARFAGAVLSRATFVEADLRGVLFDGAILVKTDLDQADLRGCAFRHVVFDRTSLTGAHLGLVDATGASGTIVASSATLEGPQGTPVTRLDAEGVLAWLRAGGATGVAIAPPVPPLTAPPQPGP